jgi:hypothetical protein
VLLFHLLPIVFDVHIIQNVEPNRYPDNMGETLVAVNIRLTYDNISPTLEIHDSQQSILCIAE